jgi:hypothetical protein
VDFEARIAAMQARIDRLEAAQLQRLALAGWQVKSDPQGILRLVKLGQQQAKLRQ